MGEVADWQVKRFEPPAPVDTAGLRKLEDGRVIATRDGETFVSPLGLVTLPRGVFEVKSGLLPFSIEDVDGD